MLTMRDDVWIWVWSLGNLMKKLLLTYWHF